MSFLLAAGVPATLALAAAAASSAEKSAVGCLKAVGWVKAEALHAKRARTVPASFMMSTVTKSVSIYPGPPTNISGEEVWTTKTPNGGLPSPVIALMRENQKIVSTDGPTIIPESRVGLLQETNGDFVIYKY